MGTSRFAWLDPIIPSATRSHIYQSFLHLARRLDPANAHHTKFDEPLLLLGSSRGGTTLLANIVGAHPRVLMYHEKFAIGRESHRDTFEASRTPAALRNSFLQFIPHRTKTANARWGVKLVAHFWTRQDLDRFLEAFPRVRIVYVVRDGRDVVLSLVKRSWRLKTPEECYERWIHSVEVFDYLRAKMSDQFLWYHYEDLVAAPEPKVRAICEFIGEPFEPALLDHKHWPGLGSYAMAPISADKTKKWQREPLPVVSAELTQRFNAALARLGYT